MSTPQSRPTPEPHPEGFPDIPIPQSRALQSPSAQGGPDPGRLAQSTADPGITRLVERLTHKLDQDVLVQQVTTELRQALRIDRVALYYFYRQWKGQVTFESLGDPALSILGSTGADDCFNDAYAQLYLEGRVRAIADIEVEAIQACHREFLSSIQVRANLVVPILTTGGLWGLLAAHDCHRPRRWSEGDIEQMRSGAARLALASTIV